MSHTSAEQRQLKRKCVHKRALGVKPDLSEICVCLRHVHVVVRMFHARHACRVSNVARKQKDFEACTVGHDVVRHVCSERRQNRQQLVLTDDQPEARRLRHVEQRHDCLYCKSN